MGGLFREIINERIAVISIDISICSLYLRIRRLGVRVPRDAPYKERCKPLYFKAYSVLL